MTLVTLPARILRHRRGKRPGFLVVLLALAIAGGLYLYMKPGMAGAGKRSLVAAADHSTTPPPDVVTTPLENTAAISRSLELLQEGQRRLSMQTGFEATLDKQEIVHGVRGPRQVIAIKHRQQPYGLYLNWKAGDARGQEILYVPAERDGEMLVKLGGIKGLFLPALKIDPFGPRALKRSTRPITQITLDQICQRMINRQREALALGKGVNSTITLSGEVDGRPCYTVTNHYATPNTLAEYRKVRFLIDRDSLLPVRVQAWGWPDRDTGASEEPLTAAKLDAQTMVEELEYRSVRFDVEFKDCDFDASNPDYRFRRQRD